MHSYNGKLVELPKKGKALIITDIHGNLTDFKKFMHIWDEYEDNKDNHLILTGDFIHAMGLENDKSVEILEYVKFLWENISNIHVLLGNHEWSTISNKSLFKAGINQTYNFDELLKEKFGPESCTEKLQEYINFFKKLPLAVRTANGIFISHAGPPTNIKSIDEIANITYDGYNSNNRKLFEFLWNRADDFDKNQLKDFLNTVDCKMMIVGHTPVDGIKLVYKKQLVVSSSYGKGKKAYVVLDLAKNIRRIKDVLNMVKYLK
ncbi:MAG TPA: metallophosphoesterase family protein [Methanobacterium sp.]|nr:metallophosphoesterase family protein [Methanobacterium sp.]